VTPAVASPVADPPPAPRLLLERVPDAPALHGPAITAPTVVALPDGTFLMLRAEDIPARGVLLRSADGRTWAQVDARASGLDAGAIVDLAANEAGALILGRTKPMTGTGDDVADQAAWASADGVTWTRVPGAAALRTIAAWDIVASSRGFAAVGDEPLAIAVAGPDGRAWARTELPLVAGIRGTVDRLAAAGNGFVAVGTVEGRSAAWRWDGAGWSRLPFPDVGSISDLVADDQRIIVTGVIEQPNAANPDLPTLAAVASESLDGGRTWSNTALSLDGISSVAAFELDGGFLAVLEPADPRGVITAWRSLRPGSWDAIGLNDEAGRPDRAGVATLAHSGSRVVLAGSVGGTGAGADRIVVWVGDLAPR
jgi:hypothetical protein